MHFTVDQLGSPLKTAEVYRRGLDRTDVREGVTAVYGQAPVAGFILELGKIWG